MEWFNVIKVIGQAGMTPEQQTKSTQENTERQNRLKELGVDIFNDPRLAGQLNPETQKSVIAQEEARQKSKPNVPKPIKTPAPPNNVDLPTKVPPAPTLPPVNKPPPLPLPPKPNMNAQLPSKTTPLPKPTPPPKPNMNAKVTPKTIPLPPPKPTPNPPPPPTPNKAQPNVKPSNLNTSLPSSVREQLKQRNVQPKQSWKDKLLRKPQPQQPQQQSNRQQQTENANAVWQQRRQEQQQQGKIDRKADKRQAKVDRKAGKQQKRADKQQNKRQKIVDSTRQSMMRMMTPEQKREYQLEQARKNPNTPVTQG